VRTGIAHTDVSNLTEVTCFKGLLGAYVVCCNVIWEMRSHVRRCVCTGIVHIYVGNLTELAFFKGSLDACVVCCNVIWERISHVRTFQTCVLCVVV